MKYRRYESYFGRFYRITSRNHDIKCERSFLIRTIFRTTNFCISYICVNWLCTRERERNDTYALSTRLSYPRSAIHIHLLMIIMFFILFDKKEERLLNYLVVDPQTTFEVLLRRVLASCWRNSVGGRKIWNLQNLKFLASISSPDGIQSCNSFFYAISCKIESFGLKTSAWYLYPKFLYKNEPYIIPNNFQSSE